MSVALFKFMKGAGSEAPADVHRHGEEVGIVLKGTARVHGTDGNEPVSIHTAENVKTRRITPCLHP